MDSESLNESAKATQEMAKTTRKGLEVSERIGGFIAQHIGGTLEQGIGLFEDKLKYYRATNQLKYIERFNELANKLGASARMKPVPLKLALPLMEAASLEDDNYLQKLWVNLLFNASNEQSKINLQRSHIAILEQLTSLEARSLEVIYSVETTELKENAVVTHNLPKKVEVARERDINHGEIRPEDPDDDIKLSLANLARLRLIALPMTFGGGELFYYVNHTLLGRRFVAACTVTL